MVGQYGVSLSRPIDMRKPRDTHLGQKTSQPRSFSFKVFVLSPSIIHNFVLLVSPRTTGSESGLSVVLFHRVQSNIMYSASNTQTPWQSNGYSQLNSHPAYLPVPTRNPYSSNLQPPPSYVPQPYSQVVPPPPPLSAPPSAPSAPTHVNAPTNEPKKKQEWSPSVRAYVQRCFASENQIVGVEKKDLEAKLRQIITTAAENGTLDSTNWDMTELPQQIIQRERNRIMLGFSGATAPPPPLPPFLPPIPLPFQTGPFQPPPGSETLRKRKSSELSSVTSDYAQTPWRKGKKAAALEDRMSMPDKRQKLNMQDVPSKSDVNLENRKRRFNLDLDRSGSSSPWKDERSPIPSEPLGPVVGTSQKLEKNYFRLTSAPKPEEVRPLAILKQTLELLKKKWRSDSNYTYICDQFKSLRQDLTVQHIKDNFTTDVYEIHARIALEKGDLGEYNQCQTQLRSLYRSNLGGHPTEFKAYRILYYIYTCNRTDMNDVLSELTKADKATREIKHALAVRSALALGNYHQFFKLYLDPPNMGAYLMDMFIERERLNALAHICRA